MGEDALTIDEATREASLGGRTLNLTRIEFDLLHALVGQPRVVLTPAVLLREVWGMSGGVTITRSKCTSVDCAANSGSRAGGNVSSEPSEVWVIGTNRHPPHRIRNRCT